MKPDPILRDRGLSAPDGGRQTTETTRGSGLDPATLASGGRTAVHTYEHGTPMGEGRPSRGGVSTDTLNYEEGTPMGMFNK